MNTNRGANRKSSDCTTRGLATKSRKTWKSRSTIWRAISGSLSVCRFSRANKGGPSFRSSATERRRSTRSRVDSITVHTTVSAAAMRLR